MTEAQVVQYGPRQTAPWQRVGLQIEVPVGATSVDFVIYVSGALGSCGGSTCGSAYFDDLEIFKVDNLAPNADLSVSSAGSPPCLYAWENGGPCAPEYLVQQYPEDAFRAELEDQGGDQVFAVEVYRDDLAPGSGSPRVQFKYRLSGVLPGEVYAFSTSVQTDALRFSTSLRATPKGGAGAIAGAQVIQSGPDQTSPWQRLGLQVTVPDGATHIDFAIYVSGSLGGCGGAPCGVAYFDDLSITRVLTHPFSNVCSEGQYFDWSGSEKDCKALEVDLQQLLARDVDETLERLHTTSAGIRTLDSSRVFTSEDSQVGFKRTAFEAAFSDYRDDRFEVTGCTMTDLQDALTSAELNGGGTIQLPACVLVVDGQIEVPARTILQGTGIGRTILVPSVPWNANKMFYIEGAQHVVVRDLTVDGMHNPGNNSGSTYGFLLREVDNVLIERVEAKDATLSAFSWEVSLNFTVRYSVASGSSLNHGYSTSDCRLGPFETIETCLGFLEAKHGGGQPLPWYWVANHAFYSNLVEGNQGSGVNSHGILAEIAGNRVLSNSQGSKFSQSQYFWVHDNLYQESAEDLIRIQHAWLDFRPPKHLLIYRNRFVGNGQEYPPWTSGDSTPNLLTFTFTDPPQDLGPALYLIHNEFENNYGRILGLPEDPLCAGSAEVLHFPPFVPGLPFETIADWSLRFGFDPDLLPASDPICQLVDIHEIFPIE